MATDKNLTIKINAETKNLEKGLSKAEKQTKKLQKNLRSLTKRSAIGFAAVTAAVTATTLSFSKFQKDFTQVITLLDKSSFATKSLADGIKDLEKGILDLRATSGESFEDLNQGLFDLISAGIPAEEAINTLAIATNLAAAGGTNVAIAVDAITTSINAFGLETSEAERVSQLFFLAQKNGVTTVEELANNMGVAASSANSYGVSLEEVLAATAAITKAGKTTSASLTGLNQVFANIAKPTKDAADEALRLGIQFDTTALRAKGLEGFLNDIITAEGFTTQSIEKLFGSVEAIGVAFALTGEQNEAFTETLKQLQDEAQLAETFNNALAEANSTVDKALKKLGGSLQAVIVALGKEFAPLIISVSDSLTNFAKFILNADTGILKIVKNVIIFTGVITGLTTALGAVGLAMIALRTGIVALSGTFGIAATAARVFWVAVTGPIGIVTAGVAALVGGFVALKNVFADDEPAQELKKVGDEIEKITEKEKELQTVVAQGNEQEKAIAQEKIENLKEEVDEAINQKARETDLKIQEAQREAEVLKQIREGATDEEVQATRDKNALLAEEDRIKLENELLNAELKTIGLNTQRQAQIENELELNQIELENIAAHREILNEAAEEQRELELEADELIKAIENEQQVQFNDQEIEQLKAHILGKKQITDKFLLDRLNQQSTTDKRFLDLQRKFGTTFAKADKLFNNEKVSGVQKTFSRLASLQDSNNKFLKAAGKVAAVGQIAISTARGALDAFSSFAKFGPIGAALGAAAAALVVAQGAEATSKVQGAVSGGLVTQGRSGVDDQPFLLSRGESVIPADITPTLLDTFRQLREIREGGGLLNTISASAGVQPQLQTKIVNEAQSLVKDFEEGEPQEINIVIGLEDEATDLITATQRENAELSIGVI